MAAHVANTLHSQYVTPGVVMGGCWDKRVGELVYTVTNVYAYVHVYVYVCAYVDM